MPELNHSELAARFGFAMAVLNSDPELKALFDRAVANTYTVERFQAELRSTKWYQNHSESWRNAQIQKSSDPASYKAAVEQVRVRLGMMAAEFGAVVTPNSLAEMAEQAYMYGWDDNQIRSNFTTYVQYTDGRLLGAAAQYEDELRTYARSMGVQLSDDTILDHVRNIVGGKTTFDSVRQVIQQTAASAFPHLADRINAGESLAQIADPYRQTMARMLEINPNELDFFDPTIRSALGSTGQDGKPVMKTLYDFENDLRKDTRWLKTKNAQDAAMETTSRILKDFGLIS